MVASAPNMDELDDGATSFTGVGTCSCTAAGVTPPTAPAVVATTVEIPSEQIRLASSAHLEALAGLLFDWRVECEGHLRVLTAIQRYVERVRSPSIGTGERTLLLQEISRLLATPSSSPDEWRQRAAALAITLP
jgi:hypothetical protein